MEAPDSEGTAACISINATEAQAIPVVVRSYQLTLQQWVLLKAGGYTSQTVWL